MKKKEKVTVEKETKQRGLFKKTRGGIVLTKEQVKEIKAGRKKLRKEMKKQKIRSRKEFELTASSMGLYFDKQRGFGLLLWLFHGRALWALLGAAAALLGVMFLFSLVSQMRGHFTINLSDNMFKNGFILSDDRKFTNPTTQLYSEPVENVPCISISSLPDDINTIDGPHNGAEYFAYTFYLKYDAEEGETCNYQYQIGINSESKGLASATWLMLFVDDKMTFYAEKGDDGKVEALPSYSESRRGYRIPPMMEKSANPTKQYEVVGKSGSTTYYRILPEPFEADMTMTTGQKHNVKPQDVHKYTVVLWLEGDDPDCTDALIGGNLGIDMNFRYLDGEDDSAGEGQEDDFWHSLQELWSSMWESLTFWEG